MFKNKWEIYFYLGLRKNKLSYDRCFMDYFYRFFLLIKIK